MVELTALSSRSGRAIATYLNFYVSHGIYRTARFLRGGEKYEYCICLADNSFCFQQWKNIQKQLTVVIAKSLTPIFFKHSVWTIMIKYVFKILYSTYYACM